MHANLVTTERSHVAIYCSGYMGFDICSTEKMLPEPNSSRYIQIDVSSGSCSKTLRVIVSGFLSRGQQ